MFSISPPKAPLGADYVGGDEAVQELKTPAVLAQEAKAKLDSLVKKGTEAEPAAGDGKPKLPVQSAGFHTPTEPIKTLPNDSPKRIRKVLVSNSNSNSLWVHQIS